MWEIHGGGFYRVEKFKVAPETLPEHALLVQVGGVHDLALRVRADRVVYFAHASTFLVDKSVADLTSGEAIALSIGGLALAWLVYDTACRLLARTTRLLAVVVAAFVVLAAWGAGQLFAPRAAYIEVGAMLGTIMAANVFFVIIPMHWKLVRAKEAGEEPDPAWNARGKQRSVHNNYFTLPVVFAMLSNHFPFTYGAHARLADPRRADGARRARPPLLQPPPQRAATPGGSSRSRRPGSVALAIAIRPPRAASNAAGPAPSFAEVQAIVANRCAPCHSLHPTQPGYSSPPSGIALETAAQIKAARGLIQTVAVDSKAMPLGNATKMTQAERDTLARWLASR